MFSQFFSCHLSDDLKLLLLLKLNYPFLDLIILGLFVHLSALLYCLPNLIEPTDDILRDFELQLVYVLILHVFDSRTDEVLIHALAEQRTGLKDESHLLFCQEFSG